MNFLHFTRFRAFFFVKENCPLVMAIVLIYPHARCINYIFAVRPFSVTGKRDSFAKTTLSAAFHEFVFSAQARLFYTSILFSIYKPNVTVTWRFARAGSVLHPAIIRSIRAHATLWRVQLRHPSSRELRRSLFMMFPFQPHVTKNLSIEGKWYFRLLPVISFAPGVFFSTGKIACS